MSRHVIKFEYRDGVKLELPEYWCGRESNGFDWAFTDAQHVALASGGSIQPCKNCVKAIIKALEVELND